MIFSPALFYEHFVIQRTVKRFATGGNAGRIDECFSAKRETINRCRPAVYFIFIMSMYIPTTSCSFYPPTLFFLKYHKKKLLNDEGLLLC
jgi:hypothetical protein